jgi:hypothetical protein
MPWGRRAQPKDGSGEPPAGGRNGERDFHGETRSNDTHASTTDPDARLYKKAAGQAAMLCHMGHVLMENRSGLVVSASVTLATGTAEREAAEAMIGGLPAGERITLGADKAYDTADFVAAMRRLGVTRHVTQNDRRRRSAIEPARPQADRGDLRLGEDGGRAAQDALSRHRAGWLDVRSVGGGLQSGAHAEAAGCRGIATPAEPHQVLLDRDFHRHESTPIFVTGTWIRITPSESRTRGTSTSFRRNDSYHAASSIL